MCATLVASSCVPRFKRGGDVWATITHWSAALCPRALLQKHVREVPEPGVVVAAALVGILVNND